MPAKSKAQFRAMYALEKKGKISSKTRREFTDTVDYADLPEQVGSGRKTPPRRKKK